MTANEIGKILTGVIKEAAKFGRDMSAEFPGRTGYEWRLSCESVFDPLNEVVRAVRDMDPDEDIIDLNPKYEESNQHE